MKENSTKKVFNNPFKDILNNELVTKTRSGINEFVSGVKNLFRTSDDKPQPATDINNYLKTEDEMETELRFISSQKEENKQSASPVPDVKEFSDTSNLLMQNKPVIFRPLEEALSGEMEENY